MKLPRRYHPDQAEPALAQWWLDAAVYRFEPAADGPVYSIDTPPPTVSGQLHLGHVYSYSQTDFLARFWRMNGHRVFYPMGFDDNGLPTERLVEQTLGASARELGRQAFAAHCLQVGAEAAQAYRQLWERLGLSVDWRHTYRTIGHAARTLSQRSFLNLLRRDLVYRQEAPTIWCPECQTAIAQAELTDLARQAPFYTLSFTLPHGRSLPIATTRPELLPACVAIFVHPEDARFAHLVGQQAAVPLFGQQVPILADAGAEREKGTGAVMCCTFGDTADVAWWRTHHLPLVEAVSGEGRLTAVAGAYQGLTTTAARQRMVADLHAAGQLLDQQPTLQTVPAHERCDTPVETIVTRQWFVRILPHKAAFLAVGRQMEWTPAHMQARYEQWVENLAWDWCISRQRAFGVPFPVWYCHACGETVPADEADLPLDPAESRPSRRCPICEGDQFTPERDVMDTWATSSLTPQIAAGWRGPLTPDEPAAADDSLYAEVTPFSLRPQAHEIIRTWAFYTIVKSHYHFGTVPWRRVAISGWALAPAGAGKISKSRGGETAAPADVIARYSADAVRYWAACTGPGRDTVISEEKIQAGARLATKLWHVARFTARFLAPDAAAGQTGETPPAVMTPADRWLLARCQELVARATAAFTAADYASARSETETFFWRDLADNYLEMAKQRLYDGGPEAGGARFALRHALLVTLQLLAPIMPFVTEEIYQGLFAGHDVAPQQAVRRSIHASRWPTVDPAWRDEAALVLGRYLVAVATAVRRYKSEQALSLGTPLQRLHLATPDAGLATGLAAAIPDLASITRARRVTVADGSDPTLVALTAVDGVAIGLAP